MIDRNDFAAWLHAHRAEEFPTNSCVSCPLAEYLHQHGVVDAIVTNEIICAEEITPLEDWMKKFIVEVDAQDGDYITGDKAGMILAGIA